jgi:hypothetical protein
MVSCEISNSGSRTVLELELLHASLVWRDGRTLDADRVFLYGFGGIDGDLVVRLVTVLQSLSELESSVLFKLNWRTKS